MDVERIQHIGCKSSSDRRVAGLLANSDSRLASNCRCVIQTTNRRMVYLVDESSAVGKRPLRDRAPRRGVADS